jgi:hypothetical protein
VTLLGGGASLRREDVEGLEGRCRVLAINDTYQWAPFADCLYWCDLRWWHWHNAKPEFKAYKGLRVTLANEEVKNAKHMQDMGTHGLQMCPWGLATGRNSGIQAINLAMHFGVARILLLGYDMKPGHFNGGHPAPTRPEVYADTMLPCFPAVAAGLKQVGVECINCTPGSALDVFPRAELADVLATST